MVCGVGHKLQKRQKKMAPSLLENYKKKDEEKLKGNAFKTAFVAASLTHMCVGKRDYTEKKTIFFTIITSNYKIQLLKSLLLNTFLIKLAIKQVISFLLL